MHRHQGQRTALAGGAGGAVHETRVQIIQCGPVHAQSLHDPGAEPFDEDVGSRNQVVQRRHALAGPQIQVDDVFVRVHNREHLRVELAGGIPRGRLDFDDPGPEPSEQGTGVRAG